MEDWSRQLASLVRPIITVLGFLAVIAMMFLGFNVPEWFQVLISTIIAFWFATRRSGSST